MGVAWSPRLGPAAPFWGWGVEMGMAVTFLPSLPSGVLSTAAASPCVSPGLEIHAPLCQESICLTDAPDPRS